MALDPLNPGMAPPTESESLVKWRADSVATVARIAKVAETMAAVDSGEVVSESSIYLRILLSCIVGRVAVTSNEMQLWATDLTRDYLAKYPLVSDAAKP